MLLVRRVRHLLALVRALPKNPLALHLFALPSELQPRQYVRLKLFDVALLPSHDLVLGYHHAGRVALLQLSLRSHRVTLQ